MANTDENKNTNTEAPMSRRSGGKADKAASTEQPTRAKRAGNVTSNETTNQPVKNTNANQKAETVMKTSTEKDEAKTKELPTRKSPAKSNTSGRTEKKDKKNNKGKMSKAATGGRSFMVTLMAVYFIVVGIIGVWGVSQFFWFYIQEKSPVMAAGTENSRVETRPDIDKTKMKAAHDAIMAVDFPVKSVTITQVGPSIHFLYVVNDDVDVNDARWIGQENLKTFAAAIEQPDAFNKYEAQIIVTKENMETLPPEVMLRPAGDEGAEQAFPQFGVTNKNTNHSDNPEEIVINVSWSRNG